MTVADVDGWISQISRYGRGRGSTGRDTGPRTPGMGNRRATRDGSELNDARPWSGPWVPPSQPSPAGAHSPRSASLSCSSRACSP